MSDLEVPFYPLQALHQGMRSELDEVWAAVVDSGEFIGGNFVEGFEHQWAATCGSRECVGVANGTDALELALLSLGLGRGDEIIVPANTFYATVEAIVAVGAEPVFVDADEETLLMNLDEVESKVGRRTSAVMAVHLYGQSMDLTRLSSFVRRSGLALVEDCAQAHGARWRSRPVGSFGAAGCFSFYPGKNLGALGDGGAVVTNDVDTADRLRSLRDHGRDPKRRGLHNTVGRNSRLDALQAGILSVKLNHLDAWNAERRRVHSLYLERFATCDLIKPTAVAEGAEAVHHLEVVRVDHRDAVRVELQRSGISTGVHYDRACPDQPGLSHLPRVDVPVSRRAAQRQLSLPMYPGMQARQVDAVCEALTAAVERCATDA